MSLRISLFIVSLLFFCGQSSATSKSEILRDNGVTLVPAIVQDDRVYIQPYKMTWHKMESISVDQKNQRFYLIGSDSKNHLLKIDSKKVEHYKNINWGFGSNEAHAFVGLSKKIFGGHLVAITKKLPNRIKWYSAKVLQSHESAAMTDWESKDFLLTDKQYGMTKRVIFKNAMFREYLSFAMYRMINNENCDERFFKESISIFAENNIQRVLISSFTDCDGHPIIKMKKTVEFYPIGPILGILEIEDNGKRETWIVTESHGYETVGLGFIKYHPKNSSGEVVYEFMITDGL